MIKKLKSILGLIGLISIIIVGSLLLSQLRNCSSPKAKDETAVPTEVYKRPIIDLPLIKKNPPVSKDELPIPESQVKRTVRVQVPGHRDIVLVFDQQDRIFRSTEAEEDVNITNTIWTPRPFSIKPRFGYALVYSGDLYHCFSLDVIRFRNISLGCEVGFRTKAIKISEALVGVSGKYNFGHLEVFKLRADIQAVLGWNFIGDKVYGGISMKW